MWRFIIALTLSFTFINVCAKNALCEQQQCIAVVDAGSTGSRVHIYSYTLDENHEPTLIKERWSKKIKPGFATLAPTPKAVGNYLSLLFKDAPAQHMPFIFTRQGACGYSHPLNKSFITKHYNYCFPNKNPGN